LTLLPSGLELTATVEACLVAAFEQAVPRGEPFRHWVVSRVFPEGLTRRLGDLPFPMPDLGGLSGKRELHNDQRHYFDVANNTRFDVCAAVADGFQSRPVVDAIEKVTGAELSQSYVRLEYALDTDGFWLEPHTDLGVKRFTMQIYLPESQSQADLGTDLYLDSGTWARRMPFVDNTALVFVPGADTWHGLERRPIAGVRKSVIMNYVTKDWRAREQLAYSDTPVRE
jgi:hypothetical protein